MGTYTEVISGDTTDTLLPNPALKPMQAALVLYSPVVS